jgi:hypothetical protein
MAPFLLLSAFGYVGSQQPAGFSMTYYLPGGGAGGSALCVAIFLAGWGPMFAFRLLAIDIRFGISMLEVRKIRSKV